MFFAIVMSVYIIRAAFDVVIIIGLPQGWGPFVKKLLQDIFYMVWDLPIVLPPLFMHYYNYRPQFNLNRA
jgi:ABC-type sulfate transport system permease component